MSRKTPILLRRGPLSREVMALYRYTHKTVRGREIIDSGLDGKQSVQADYDALVLEELLDPDSPDIVGILDGAADGQSLNDDERAQIRAFRERLKAMCERHNARAELAPQGTDASAAAGGFPSPSAPRSPGRDAQERRS